MRAVRCWCDELVVADDDESLVHEVGAHARETHPDDVREEEEIRSLVRARAEEPPDRPPWAY